MVSVDEALTLNLERVTNWREPYEPTPMRFESWLTWMCHECQRLNKEPATHAEVVENRKGRVSVWRNKRR